MLELTARAEPNVPAPYPGAPGRPPAGYADLSDAISALSDGDIIYFLGKNRVVFDVKPSAFAGRVTVVFHPTDQDTDQDVWSDVFMTQPVNAWRPL